MIPSVLQLRRFRVREIIWESAHTYTLVLVPENQEEMIRFQAGQWIYLHVLNEDGTSWGKAAFSIASGPEESADRLELGIKIQGELTRRASRLGIGAPVALQGPFGVFSVRPTDEEPYVFLGAGIGVTPLRSMISSLVKRDVSAPIYLFYSNKTIEETAYREMFEKWKLEQPGFQPVYTLTANPPLGWRGERGRIDGSMLDRWLPDVERGTFYACGPEPFMQTLERHLQARGVDTKKRFRKELFG